MKLRTQLRGAKHPRLALFKLAIAFSLVFTSLSSTSFDTSRAQVRPVYDEGAEGLGLALRRLQTTASVLHIGAHPDDEDSALIARLARTDGARVAYLSLNRGEGGQNRIGPELFDALGVIRTEELLQARRLDGGQQFFARTFDFGFTKTLAESRRRWDEREVLADMVRVIRTFRPLVVVSRWQGTPADGHGQHQFSGYLAPKAFRAAGDPTQFPEQIAEGLRPWQPLKFYVSANLNAEARNANASATTNSANANNANATHNNSNATHNNVNTRQSNTNATRSNANAANATQGNANSNAATSDDAAATAGDVNARRAPLVRIETGDYDPLLGRSPYELAMEGRSQHKSQGETALELKGEQASGARLVDAVSPYFFKGAQENSLFDGIDTTIFGIVRVAGFTSDTYAGQLQMIQYDAAAALEKFNASDPRTVIAPLVAGLAHTRAARRDLASVKGVKAYVEADFLLAEKEREFADALRLATGARADALADAETVARGDSFNVVVRAYAPQELKGRVTSVRLRAPEGWKVEEVSAPQATGTSQSPSGQPPSGASQSPSASQSSAASQSSSAAQSSAASQSSSAAQAFGRERATREAYFRVSVPETAEITRPYWLKRERKGDLYEWGKDDPQTLPFAPPPVVAEITFDAGETYTVERPVEYRYLDNVRGEVRRELNVVPEIDVRLTPALAVVSRAGAARGATVEFTVQLTNNARRTTEAAGDPIAEGTVTLSIPEGWREPRPLPFRFDERGERATLKFSVGVPAGVARGAYPVSASASAYFRARPQPAVMRAFGYGERALAYPHIQTRRYYAAADATVRAFDLGVADVRVGYLMGSGDEVPAAIERMGLKVSMLGEDDLSTGDLSRFDTIVVGVRASQSRPDFVANNKRLLDFVNRGGTLVVQYQRPDYAQRGLPPFPATMETRTPQGQADISRVVDETAPVSVLAPESPVFNFPNKITDEDFRGWVQERDLYNFVTFDARYTPLLESHDAGEPENAGGMVFARLGRGVYVYTSYAFFRQLPAGVPGAYRLFANLISLPKSPAGNAPARN